MSGRAQNITQVLLVLALLGALGDFETENILPLLLIFFLFPQFGIDLR